MVQVLDFTAAVQEFREATIKLCRAIALGKDTEEFNKNVLDSFNAISMFDIKDENLVAELANHLVDHIQKMKSSKTFREAISGRMNSMQRSQYEILCMETLLVIDRIKLLSCKINRNLVT